MEVMTAPLAKIWARRIHAGTRTLDEVNERYGSNGFIMVSEAYFELFGEVIS